MDMHLLILLVTVLFVFQTAFGLSSFCTWVERKGSALLQQRIGANRAGAYFQTSFWPLKPVLAVLGWFGVLGVINTMVCDPVKALFKEDFIPKNTPRIIHDLAPFMAVAPVFLAFAVVPLAPKFSLPFVESEIVVQVARLDAGVLFVLAMGSLATYGVLLAGWAANNKFSLLGGLRAGAQMFSYELAMGISLVTMLVLYGTPDIYRMVEAQSSFFAWGVFRAPVAFVILFVVGMAETKRAPFDLPEAESELVSGYFTEYSGMKFLLFWMGEFAEIALFALLLSLLFFGGWHLPGVPIEGGTWWLALIGHGVLMTKVALFCVLQIVIRWTLPRFRFDQLMGLGWKILLPLSIVNLMVTAAIVVWSGGAQ